MGWFDGLFGTSDTQSVQQPLFQSPTAQQQLQAGIAAEAQKQGITLPATPAQQPGSFLENPAFIQALASFGGTLTQANQRGISFGNALAMANNSFTGAYAQGQDKQRQAEREATADQLAYLKDISGLRLNQHQSDLQDKRFDLDQTNSDRDFTEKQSEFGVNKTLQQQGLDIQRGNQGIQQQELTLKKQQQDQETAGLQAIVQAHPELAGLPASSVKQIVTNAAERANTPPTDGQVNAGGFANRVAASNAQITQYTPALTGAAGLGGAAVSSIPVIGNSLASPDYQSADQASRNFINATLRRESGSAIAQSEFDNAYKQYLPRTGDSKQVLAQKQANREQVLQTLTRGAGRNFTLDPLPTAPGSGLAGWSISPAGK